MLQKHRFINAREWNHITAEVVEGCHWMQAPTLVLCCRNGGASSKGKTIDLYIHSECLFLWKIRVVPVYVCVCVCIFVCLFSYVYNMYSVCVFNAYIIFMYMYILDHVFSSDLHKTCTRPSWTSLLCSCVSDVCFSQKMYW